jgi:hypothetical protein
LGGNSVKFARAHCKNFKLGGRGSIVIVKYIPKVKWVIFGGRE